MTDHVVNVFPVVEGDQLEGGEHGPRERVEIGESEIGIGAQSGDADVASGAGPWDTKENVVFSCLFDHHLLTYQAPVRLPHSLRTPV